MKHAVSPPDTAFPWSPQIGLLDHMGFGNMGDAAILESFITNIRKRSPNVLLTAFSLYPEDTRKRHDISCYPITWSHPGPKPSATAASGLSVGNSRLRSFMKSLRLIYPFVKALYNLIQEFAFLIRSYRLIRSLDLLVMSGGGQLCELYGSLPYNVFKFSALAWLARTPLFIVGVGADLLEHPMNQRFAKWAVQLSSYTSFRSAESQAAMRVLGVTKETHVCPDPAYALDLRGYVSSERGSTLTDGEAQVLARNLLDAQAQTPDFALKAAAAPSVHCTAHSFPGQDAFAAAFPNRSRRVGVNPIGFCDPRRWPRKDPGVYSAYLDSLAALCAWLLDRNYQLELFTSDFTGDFYALDDLHNRTLARTTSPSQSALVVRPLLTLKHLFLQMSTFDFVVTSRFHGVIFSHMLSKPVIALSYLPKIDHLMKGVGHESYCIDIERCDAASLIGRFALMVEQEDALRSLFNRTVKAHAAALEPEFDRLVLAATNSSDIL